MGNLHFVKMKTLLKISLLATLPVLSNAESNLEESLLAELQSLRNEVSSLRERVESLEEKLDGAMATNTGPAVEESGILDRLTDAMHTRQVTTHYPWMEKSIWDKIQKGMSQEDVMGILGEPSMTDPSLHKRIDTVFTYRGRHPGTGEKIIGKVKFRRNAVVVIEKP
jgi:hypothetical protein